MRRKFFSLFPFSVLKKIKNVCLSKQKEWKGKLDFLLHKKDGFFSNGIFYPFDGACYDFVNRKTHLVVPKGKYQVLPKSDASHGEELVVSNTQAAYDVFWGDDSILDGYLCKERLKSYKDIVKEIQPFLRGCLIEVGCGTGNLLKMIAEQTQVTEIVGTDFSKVAIEQCQKHLSQGQFFCADIYTLSSRNKKYDVVICSEVLEHLERPKEAYESLLNICQKGGTLIITIPNGLYDNALSHFNFWSKEEFLTLIGEREVKHFSYLDNEHTMLFVIRK